MSIPSFPQSMITPITLRNVMKFLHWTNSTTIITIISIFIDLKFEMFLKFVLCTSFTSISGLDLAFERKMWACISLCTIKALSNRLSSFMEIISNSNTISRGYLKPVLFNLVAHLSFVVTLKRFPDEFQV